MKKDLLKKVQSYSALAAGILAADAVEAQIVYTDVDPDVDVAGNFDAADWRDETAWARHQIDLDDDGNADYTLRVRSDQQHGAGFLDPAGSNEYINNPDDNPFAKPLDEGTQIGGDDTQVWKELKVYPNGYNYLGTLTTLGKSLEEGGGGWTGQQDKYLGLKFYIGTNVHYGWARLDVRDDSRVYTLKDYAYQSTPDTPIDAGDDGSVGIAPSNLSNNYTVFATDNRVIVERTDGEAAGAQVRIFNLSGQEVTSRAMTGNRIELSMEAPNGIYLVKVSDQKKNYVKKIYIR